MKVGHVISIDEAIYSPLTVGEVPAARPTRALSTDEVWEKKDHRLVFKL